MAGRGGAVVRVSAGGYGWVLVGADMYRWIRLVASVYRWNCGKGGKTNSRMKARETVAKALHGQRFPLPH